MSEIQSGDYRHYKGRDYRVIATARHSETEEELVVYRQLYGAFGLWVRPVAMFAETVTVDGEEVPRFAFLGKHRPPHLLSTEAFARAQRFLAEDARGLERTLFSYHFGGGPGEVVLTELATFQNSDGGFGHGLEPDLQLKESSVLATTVALQILRAIGVQERHPLVRGAMNFLLNHFNKELDYWPIIPANVDDAPHAPWWQPTAADPASAAQQMANPRAEVVGYVLDYPAYTTAEFRTHLLDAVVGWLEQQQAVTPGEMEMHAFLCYRRLLETPTLPDSSRARLAELLQPIVAQIVVSEPSAWSGYGLRPVGAAPTPASPFAARMRDLLELNLDYLIESQQADGSWQPSWNWGDLTPDSWVTAQQAWSGMLTLDALLTLRAFGRLEGIEAS